MTLIHFQNSEAGCGGGAIPYAEHAYAVIDWSVNPLNGYHTFAPKR